jgi:glutathione S-transferase
VKTIGQIEKFPRLRAWGETLINRPSTHSFPPDEFEALYRRNLKRRNKWVSQFVDSVQVAAE